MSGQAHAWDRRHAGPLPARTARAEWPGGAVGDATGPGGCAPPDLGSTAHGFSPLLGTTGRGGRRRRDRGGEVNHATKHLLPCATLAAPRAGTEAPGVATRRRSGPGHTGLVVTSTVTMDGPVDIHSDAVARSPGAAGVPDADVSVPA